MFLLLATALLQQPSPDYLAVDGVAIGVLEGGRWTVAKSLETPVTLGMSEVGVGIASGRASNIHLAQSRFGPWIEAGGFPSDHVLFSGKAWLPRPCAASLERGDVLSTVAQFARNRGVPSPRPYLLNVWEIDLDGDGTKEQIIEAVSNLRDPSAQPWEAILLRWRDQRQERVYPLSISFPAPGHAAARCRVRALADFDGDGRIEVISTATGNTFLFATIWSFREGKLSPMLDAALETSVPVGATLLSDP